MAGDTLTSDLTATWDCIYVARDYGKYNRSRVFVEADRLYVISRHTGHRVGAAFTGLLSLNSPQAFARELLVTERLEEAIERYSQTSALAVCEDSSWLDFGHLQSYLDSRKCHLSSRNFNTLNVDGKYVKKESKNALKIVAERDWFLGVPSALKRFLPDVQSNVNDPNTYLIEYLNYPSLAELFVFAKTEPNQWERVFEEIASFLNAARRIDQLPTSLPGWDLQAFWNHTVRRVEGIRVLDIERPIVVNGTKLPSVLAIAEHLYAQLMVIGVSDIAICHGDLCFSNILYDFRNQRIKLIDPRGIDFKGERSILGDQRYDLAKLYHSIEGCYDQIVSGRFRLTSVSGSLSFNLSLPQSSSQKDLQRMFDQQMAGHFDSEAIRHSRTVAALLFLNMVPLHPESESRQLAFVCNSARLFAELSL
jgi:hypothetical protein